MNAPQNPKQNEALTKQGTAEGGLAPLDIIRTETVFSRLPIHQLSKKGKIDIRIIRRECDGGQISLYWKVSPNPEFGEPRQLAYRLDKLIIDRRIDEIGRPVPRLIRLGSLHSIAEKLGLKRDTNELKRIFRQNALLGITARVKYRNTQGREESVDATFTRYTVYFRGQELPSGARAETVFLGFNDPYLAVLNNSINRPQDYEYLSQLAPTAQRFYELASFKIFAALSNRYPTAKLSYSDFCTTAPQTRYYDYDHVKKQMYKIHRPHLQSGYLKQVRFSATRDAAGDPDWDMIYTPGPRAEREYLTFSRKNLLPKGAQAIPEVAQAHTGMVPSTDATPAHQLGLNLTVSPLAVVRSFHEAARGVTDYTPAQGSREVAQAEKLLKAHGLEKVNFIINYAIRQAERTKFQMQTFGAVQQYVHEALQAFDRIRRDEEEARQIQAEREEAGRRRMEAELEAERKGKELLNALSVEERQALYDEVKNDLLMKFPQVSGWKPEAVEPAIEARMVSRLFQKSQTEG
jgi:hypothetical protein